MSSLSELDGEDVELLIVLPSAVVKRSDWTVLESWLAAGGSLLLVGVRPELSEQLDVKRDARCTEPARLAEPALVPGARLLSLARTVELGESWSSEVTCGGSAVIATRLIGSGRILLIADGDFTTNASLAAGDHARVLLALLGRPASVEIVDRVTGAGAESPYRAIWNTGLAPLLGHGLAWLVLWALSAGLRFGTARDPVEQPRRALSEHIRAVARCYERAGASRHALAVYAAWALERLHSRLSPGKTPRGGELVSHVARATRREEAEIASVLEGAAAARDRPQEPNQTGADLATIATLGELVRETGGKR